MDRNFRVVGLEAHADDDVFTVVTQREGRDPEDTGQTPSEFVGYEQLVDRDEDGGSTWSFTDKEERILLRGFKRDGTERTPSGKKPRSRRREPLPQPTDRPADRSAILDGEQTQAHARCRMCEVVQPLDHFSRYARSKTGRRNYCKQCAKEAALAAR